MVGELKATYEQVVVDFEALLVFFGVPSHKTQGKNPGDFFGSLKEFVALLAIPIQQPPALKKGPSFGVALPTVKH